jgi:hypothetical protein
VFAPLVYLLASLLGAFFGLLGGYLGGVGGTRQLRNEVSLVNDDIEVLQRRLARREASAVREKERITPKNDINDEIRELLLMRALQPTAGAASPPVASREQLSSRVRSVFGDGE